MDSIPLDPSVHISAANRGLRKCPKCGAVVRVDHLALHLRRVHHGRYTKIQISDLARVLGIKQAPTRDLRECPECGVPVRADRLPRHLRSVHEKHGRPTNRRRQGRVPAEILVNPAKVPAERLPFQLLPPGTWDVDYMIRYYRREAHRLPADIRDREIDPARLETITKYLGPIQCYVGTEQWHGYHAFEFAGSSGVVLECPIRDNATYILWGD